MENQTGYFIICGWVGGWVGGWVVKVSILLFLFQVIFKISQPLPTHECPWTFNPEVQDLFVRL